MKVIVSASFMDESKKTEFITQVRNMLSEMCGGQSIDSQSCGDTLFLVCQETILLPAPIEEPVSEPTPELAPAAQIELPTEEPQLQMTIELPPETAVAPSDIAVPTVDVLAPEEQGQIDCGRHIIMSLNTAVDIETVRDPSSNTSTLEVGSVGVNAQGQVTFWYAGSEYFMPVADEAMRSIVFNPEHQISTTTIRIIAGKIGSIETIPLFVDVVSPNPEGFTAEKLVFGSDVNGMYTQE